MSNPNVANARGNAKATRNTNFNIPARDVNINKVIDTSFDTFGIPKDKIKMTDKKEFILKNYIACLPMLRMIAGAGIIHVPNPEYLFNLYTEEEAFTLLDCFIKAYNTAFADVVFIETYILRDTYNTLLFFSSLSQFKYEEFLTGFHKSFKGQGGGGETNKNYFEELFKKGTVRSQKGGVTQGQNTGAGTGLSLVPANASETATALATGSAVGQTAIVEVAKQSLQAAQQGLQAADIRQQTALTLAETSQEDEITNMIYALSAIDIVGQIKQTLRDTGNLETYLTDFLIDLKKHFTTSKKTILRLDTTQLKGTTIESITIQEIQQLIKRLGEPELETKPTKQSQNTINTIKKVPEKAFRIVAGYTEREGTPVYQWDSVALGAACLGATAAAGAWWTLRTTEHETVPIQATWGEFNVQTINTPSNALNEYTLRFKPGTVWGPKPISQDERAVIEGALTTIIEPPLAFNRDTVTLLPPTKRVVQKQFGRFVSSTPETVEFIPPEQTHVNEQAKTWIAHLESQKKIKQDRQAKLKGYGIGKMSEAETSEYNTLTAEIADIDKQIGRYSRAVHPSLVAQPYTIKNGERVPGVLLRERTDMQEIQSCPMGTDYKDLIGCVPKFDKENPSLVWNPSIQRFEPQFKFISSGTQYSCDIPSKYPWQTTLGVVGSVAAGVVATSYIGKINKRLGLVTGVATLTAGLAFTPGIATCASAGASLAMASAAGPAVALVGVLGGALAATGLVSWGVKKLDQAEIDKKIGKVNIIIENYKNEKIKEALTTLFLTNIINGIQTLEDRDYGRLIKHIANKLEPREKELIRKYINLSKINARAVATYTEDVTKLLQTLIPRIVTEIIREQADRYKKNLNLEIQQRQVAHKKLYGTDLVLPPIESSELTQELIIRNVMSKMSNDQEALISIANLLNINPKLIGAPEQHGWNIEQLKNIFQNIILTTGNTSATAISTAQGAGNYIVGIMNSINPQTIGIDAVGGSSAAMVLTNAPGSMSTPPAITDYVATTPSGRLQLIDGPPTIRPPVTAQQQRPQGGNPAFCLRPTTTQGGRRRMKTQRRIKYRRVKTHRRVKQQRVRK